MRKVRPFRLRVSTGNSGKVEGVIALLCPGQGSQTPGMLHEWLELDGAREFLSELSEAAETDLISLGTTGGAEEIKDTSVAQPLIVATSLLAAWALTRRQGDFPTWVEAVAGHSVGEFAATAISGVLTNTEATALVGVRGRAMARAAAETPTGMAAVLAPDPDAAGAAITAAGLVAANVNGGGQIVAAGSQSDLDTFAANPPEKTRVIPLAVAGAFHTDYMSSAVPEVSAAAQQLTPGDPRVRLLSNSDGQPVSSGQAMVDSLVSQITNPVRWDQCQETLADLRVSAIIELAPGGVLTGLARRTLRGVPAIAIKTPADLDGAVDLITEHRPAAKES